MYSKYNRRAAIIVCLCAGRVPKEIIEFTKLPKLTIYDGAKAFYVTEGSGTPVRKTHDRSEFKKCMPEFLWGHGGLQDMINDNPGISMRNLAARLNMGQNTIWTAVHTDLRCKSYILKVWQMLSGAMKIKRVEQCSKLLISLKHGAAGKICFCSDEKIICVDAKVNRRNGR